MTPEHPGTEPEGRSLFAGRYRIHEVIGRGGLATVYRAEDALLGRTVALKELIEPLAEQRRGQRLVEEARAAAALSHPHIAALYDTFEEGGRRYIIMEYVDGGNLRDLLDRNGGAVDPATAAAITSDIADALDYAHRLGIIHSNIKPQNILLDRQGRAKLVDFGIARAASQAWALASTLGGSAAYLAPEQVEGGRPDARSDTYALGLVLYEMLAGRLPFDADNPASLASQRLVRDPVPLRIYAPEVPHALENIVMRCLARSVENRYPTAWDLSAALDVYRESDPAMLAPDPSDRPRLPYPEPPSEGSRWLPRLLVVAAIVLTFALAAAFVPVVINSIRDSDTTALPTPAATGGPGGEAPAGLTASPTATPAPRTTATPTPPPTPQTLPEATRPQ
ncbi:MAG: serine/threonine protein kinase [Dehalococcoidia bacterium]|nr:serine/threonine protein kinase [Dehalococcoidia bacterium]